MTSISHIEVTETALEHLNFYRKFESNIILNAIKTQLPQQPTQETRNRKLLRENPVSDWELRVRKYRVFYEVDQAARLIRIVAIGHKEHNKLFIGGEEIDL